MWVSNEYVLELAAELKAMLPPEEQGRRGILLGASVHPYAPNFRERVAWCVDHGAVLLKWLPSAQQINLADDRVGAALEFLATARQGRPLPVLLHVGTELAIRTTDPKTTSYDFLSWSTWDRFWNRLRPQRNALGHAGSRGCQAQPGSWAQRRWLPHPGALRVAVLCAELFQEVAGTL